MVAVVIPSDLHTDHDVGVAVPGKISIVEATSTVKGKVALATASDYPSPGNDVDAVTPAYLQAAIAALPPPPSYVDCNSNPVPSGTPIATCANLAAATSDCQIFDGPVADPRPDVNPGMRVVGVDTSSPTCQNVKFEVATYSDIEGTGPLGQEPGRRKLVTVDALGAFVRSDNTNRIYGIGVLAANNSIGNTVSASGFRAAEDNVGSLVDASGREAARFNTGSDLTAYGYFAARNNTGSNASIFGHGAGRDNTGNNVSLSGHFAGQANTGDEVSAFGHATGQNNTGDKAALFGYGAGQNNTGSEVSLFGFGAGQSNVGSNVSAFGHVAGQIAPSNDSSYYGHRAGQVNTGFEVSVYGHISAQINTGNFVCSFGHKAGYSNTGSNVSIHGLASGAANSGNNCAFGGYYTGFLNDANDASAFGYWAGNGAVTLVETHTVLANTATTVTLSAPTAAAIGSRVVILFNSASTIENTAGVIYAFTVTSPTLLTRVNTNPFLSFGLTGSDVGATLIQSTNQPNASSFGNYAYCPGPNQAALGGPSQTPVGFAPFTVVSDGRDKLIEENYPIDRRGMPVIERLRPKAFRYNHKSRYNTVSVCPESGQVTCENRPNDGSLADTKINFGFIAQDVLAATDAAGVPKNGSGVCDMKDEGGEDKLMLDTTALIADLVLAVQELKREIDILKRRRT